jgi:putative DNA primase/helicase
METPRPLYGLPDLLKSTGTVYVTEGEKAADAARSIGLTATTSPHGGQSEGQADWWPLAGKDVVILPDHDGSGGKYGHSVAAIPLQLNPPARWCILPLATLYLAMPEGGGIVEFIAARRQDGKVDDEIRAEIEAAVKTMPEPSVEEPEQLIVVTMSSVTSRKVEWLWPLRIPRGAITVFDGDPGLGKSTTMLDVAARVTQGWRMPPDHGPGGDEPADVIVLSAEDDPETTLRPRLDAAGADVGRVHLIAAIKGKEGERPPVLPIDLKMIEQLILTKRVRLLIVDPFSAFIDGKIDTHKDSDVRRAMHLLKELAERTGVAIVLIQHLNKVNLNIAWYRGGGSIAIVGAARSGLVAAVTPTSKTPASLPA